MIKIYLLDVSRFTRIDAEDMTKEELEDNTHIERYSPEQYQDLLNEEFYPTDNWVRII